MVAGKQLVVPTTDPMNTVLLALFAQQHFDTQVFGRDQEGPGGGFCMRSAVGATTIREQLHE